VLAPLLVLHRAVLVGQLEEAAAIDGKTGLLNAHTWGARAEHELRRARGAGVPHAVLVLDLDHFKGVNDLYGHLAGDQVLAAVAKALRSEVRERDLVGRFGGEEFVILLVGRREGGETDLGVIAERIRERVAGLVVDVTTVDGAARISRLSVSVGGALHPGGRADLDGLLRIADTALYSAKRAGRNQVRMGRARLLTLRDRPVAQDHPDVRPPSP
jgi:diguanylate cyclase (GGDEF)-like protein